MASVEAQGPAFTFVEAEDTSKVTYSGTGWTSQSCPLCSGGRSMSSAQAGDTASFAFSGASISVVFANFNRSGIVEISVDGTFSQTLNLLDNAAGGTRDPTEYVIATDLPVAQHTISILVTGQGFSYLGAVSSRVNIDGFRYGDLPFGTLQGRVLDPDGDGIYGASVSLSGGESYTLTTGADGVFGISGLSDGSYSLTASATNYAAQTISDVVVQAGQVTTADIKLPEATGHSLYGRIYTPHSNRPAFRLPGETLDINVKAGSTASGWSASLSTVYTTIPLTILSAGYDAINGWTLTAAIPSGAPKELYDLTVTSSSVADTQPRAVRVVGQFEDPFYFVVLGDPQAATVESGQVTLNRVVDEINLINPALVLAVGDLTDDNTASEYEAYLQATNRLRVPSYGVPGNHDVGGTGSVRGWALWKTYLGRRFYSFDYGAYHFVGLDDSLLHTMDPSVVDVGGYFADQVAWTEADLAAHQDSLLRFPFLHITYNGSASGDSLPQWKPAWLDELHANMVLSGHDATNRVEIDGQTPVHWVETIDVTPGHGYYRLVRISQGAIGSYTYNGSATAPIQSGSLNVTYSPANDGSNLAVTGTITNQLLEHFEHAQLRFLMARQGCFQTDHGTISQQVNSDDGQFTLVYVTLDVPATSTTVVTAAACGVPPDTSLTSTPPNPDKENTPTFSFSGSDPGASGVAGFECRVDVGSWYTCSSPHTTASLTDGGHTFSVRAVDNDGNVDPSPASYTWMVDTAPPDTTLTATPPNPDNDNTPTFSFSGSDSGGSGVAGFECRVDAGSWSACSSPHTTAALTDGSHTFRVRATDNAGNVDASPASYTWTVDTVPPNTTLNSTPPNPNNDNTPTFSFGGSDPGGSGVAGFECRVDAGTWYACSSPHTTAPLTDDSHTFSVRAVDSAGNADASPASYTWTVDATPPDTTLTATPPNPDADSTATFSFGGNDGSGTGVAGFQCRVDSSGWATCSSPYTTPALSDGSHTFSVRAVDNAGNTDLSPASYTWTVDTTPPNTTLTSTPPNPNNDNTPTFSFSGNDGSGSGVASFQCQVDAGTWYACSSPHTTASLSDGSHTFRVRAVDNVGNVDASPASYTWTVDTAAPDTTLISTPPDPDNDNTATFSFGGNDGSGSGVASFQCQVDGSGWATCSSPYTTPSLSEGDHTFSVRAVDYAGNVDASPASYTWTVDTTPPDTTFTSTPSDPENDNTPTFSFNGSDASGVAGFECQVDGGSWYACSSPHTTASLTDGAHTFRVRAADNAGNVDPSPASYTWTVDTTPPDAVGDGGTPYTTDEDTPFSTGDVLDNDSDPGGGPIDLVSYDDSALAGTLTDNGDGTFDYDPAGQFEYLGAGEQAEDIFTYTIADAVDLTDSAQVIITITGVNDGPGISDISNQFTRAGVPVGPVAFTVDDVDTPASSLSLSFSTSNPALVDPQSGVTFGGSEKARSLIVTPSAGITGTAVITVTVSDGDLEASTPFVLAVEPRRIFLPLILRGWAPISAHQAARGVAAVLPAGNDRKSAV